MAQFRENRYRGPDFGLPEKTLPGGLALWQPQILQVREQSGLPWNSREDGFGFRHYLHPQRRAAKLQYAQTLGTIDARHSACSLSAILHLGKKVESEDHI